MMILTGVLGLIVIFMLGVGSAFAIATLSGMITSPNDLINPWLLWGSVLFWFVFSIWWINKAANK